MCVEFRKMGAIETCFIGLLQKSVTAIGAQYACFLTEKTEDNQALIGLEIGLTKSSCYPVDNPLFFWREKNLITEKEMQILALEALQALQMIYGFTIVDFNYHKILFQQKLTKTILAIATDALNYSKKMVDTWNSEKEQKYQYFLSEFYNISK